MATKAFARITDLNNAFAMQAEYVALDESDTYVASGNASYTATHDDEQKQILEGLADDIRGQLVDPHAVVVFLEAHGRF
jgi:hypothetical protein